ELVGVEQEISAVEQGQAALRTEADAAQSELSRCEVKLAESRSRTEFLAEEAQREFQADLAAIDWKRELWHADDEPEGIKPLDLDEEEDAAAGSQENGAAAAQINGTAAAKPRRRKARAPKGEPTESDLAALEATNWDEFKVEIEALRQRLRSMGEVNLVAIEEYAELKQRHDFLKNQSDDLTNAKTELLKAEDILESGIEIVAQPPGTKLKSISLLSGGQKTLTAVALLFALYLVKPSPFCLLDELDAP